MYRKALPSPTIKEEKKINQLSDVFEYYLTSFVFSGTSPSWGQFNDPLSFLYIAGPVVNAKGCRFE